MALARTPRYSRFITAGAGVGVVLGFVLVAVRHDTGRYSAGTALVYTALVLGALGALAGGVAAVLLDRRAP
ncbi:hypothetical protein CLV35_2147 [Motilibacter peucedani]|uniref:Uncharacterized protein n=1 Tax=Motilibacter peucedani TaxID=598650 RepID=A0A420XQW9_9ACTN|nr:hypothetical protein [Motilibacter peucedani]RKS75670.1 hypothetical protein CLV35_2147 [Motilibacter peucedani]